MAKKHKHKQKQKKQKAERRRQQKRSERNARKARPRGPSGSADDFDDFGDLREAPVRLPSIDPPAPERSAPPIHLDAAGRVVDDPYAVLGVDRGADEEAILAAWRRKILEHPPERDPEGARRLQEARARLLDPSKVIERELGAIHIPDPAAYGLESSRARADEKLPALTRAVGQLALYALLEELLADSADMGTSAEQLRLLPAASKPPYP